MSNIVPIPSPGVPLAYGEPGAPLVVVLHDWYGRLPWLEPYGEALADRGGFRVLVPDLYDGVATTDAGMAEQLAGKLDDDHARDLLDAAVASARAEGSQRVGLVGFSLGASVAMASAARGDADALVAYYPAMGEYWSDLLPCPFLVHLAETDEFESPDEAAVFLAGVRDQGTTVAAHTYAGTVHNFANATIAEVAETRSAALAFARTTVFLESHLD